mgnify:CR=1 FL=1
MQIIDLPVVWTILIDCIAWAILQPGVASLAMQIPIEKLDPNKGWFRPAKWEADGEFYQRWLRIKAWKSRIPSLAGFFGSRGFRLDRLESSDPAYLDRWVRETCRAEITHWAAMLPSILFFLWNPPIAGWFMVLYAFVFNFPLILIQRYNRPRVLFQLARQSRRIR